jgi:hypothetical protein
MITNEELNRLRNTLGAIVHATASVTTTASDILPTEPERVRRKLTITNVGDTNTVFLALGQNAVVNAGICLWPGASFTLDAGESFSGRISAITAAGTSTLAIFAAYRQGE